MVARLLSQVMVTDVAPMSIGIHVIGGRTVRLLEARFRTATHAWFACALLA